MNEFDFQADVETLPLIYLIVETMMERFSIRRDEAIGRMNRLWRGQEIIGAEDLIFHEDEEYWANTIYYGKDSMWWQNPPKLQPLPYP
jgi:hypothetical protein